MNWLNTPTSIIHAPEYVGSEPTQRATWWNLMVYCAEQENGGVIVGGSAWKDRRWQQTCGVTAEEIHDDCDLWERSGNDIVLWGYPKDKETEVKAKREGGSIGGKRRAENAVSSIASSSASRSPSSSASTERKGKEGNGIGKEVASAPVDASVRDGIPFPDFPPEPNGNHPKESASHMNELAARVRGLRPEWKKMALTYAEMRSLTECAASLEGLDADDWENIRRYLAAKLPEGSGGWQPRSRAKFLESAPDVYSHAAQWASKNKPATSQPRTGGWK
jgi:hypothetical protein